MFHATPGSAAPAAPAGDSIAQLQSDSIPPSHDDAQIVEMLFTRRNNTMTKIYNSSKDAVLVGSLFFLISLPATTELIERFIPVTRSPYTMIIVKALILMAVYFFLSRLYLVQKGA